MLSQLIRVSMPWCQGLLLFSSLALSGCSTFMTEKIDAPATIERPVKIERPLKIALALGGGAAKGFAHIGVIKVLEANGIQPDIVVGTSAGSVVGALYAAGNTGFDLQKIALQMDENEIGDWTLSLRGVVRGDGLQNYVNKSVQNRPIEKLNKPFAAVATELSTGQMTIFEFGNTGMAVRASSAVPGVFQPVSINGKEYVDGGLTSPIPVRAAKRLGADVVIAVDISSKPELAETTSYLSILLKTFTIMGRAISSYELNDADIVIRPASLAGSTNFNARHANILEGEKATQALINEIKTLIKNKKAQLNH